MNQTYIAQDINGPLLAAVFATEMVLALIANGVVLSITIYQRKSWKQSSTIFFTSLILAHLVLNLLYLPFTVIGFAAGEWIFGSTDQVKRGFCKFNAYILWYSILNIIMMLAAISVDRFLFIVKPHLHKRFMSQPKVALTLTIAIWLLAAVLSSTPFFGLGEFGYETWFGGCLPLWTTIEFTVYTIIVCLVIIFIISLTSIWTFCFARRFLTDQSRLTTENNVYYSSKKQRLIGIFGAMSLVYLLCFSPGIISAFLTPLTLVPYEVIVLVIVTIELLTIAGPLVQSYFRPDINKVLVSLYTKMRRLFRRNMQSVCSNRELDTKISYV
ncbi:PREDICTED: high-affinity lysophosphatidic acid receptor-like isoform X2 [Amphimedon queenslandica]|uniref:G-protein coupled receptors family 1 profile domain-containing protein n=1 Tax=Amphimedon queenslandica TaxID=400682 RepID=A0AAN0JL69_AMPQE|nr:PREDICTED: high-affinity lysophosphatidic acid receptor-like isoform X2 [Amphimedon queenslandica]|eukprot:XP_019857753.1 PREDICTED: high-affinity lysophosphatidic acid receptor-like isoform X2 [Amphimedon queenslandica]